MVYGSLTIEAGDPRIGIGGVVTDLFVGDSIDKIGRTTGWTYGYVANTCRDINVLSGDGSTFTTLCAGVVQAGAGGGDSGAPVFWQGTNGQYVMAGVLFGGLRNYDAQSGTEYYFSNWRYVSYDLTGSYSGLNPARPVPGLSAAVSGPSYIGMPGTYTWTATASGGTSYSYQWQESTNNSTWFNIGTDSNTYSDYEGSDGVFYLRVSVTSGSASATSSSYRVTVAINSCGPQGC